MERVSILINKLQEQLKQQADAKSMLVTVQMLNTELMQSMQQKNGQAPSKVSVVMPYHYMASDVETVLPKNEIVEKPSYISTEKVELPVAEDVKEFAKKTSVAEESKVEVPQPTPAEPKKEEPRKEHSSWIFDPIEAPTLAHQEKVVYELNESLTNNEASINDRLKIEKIELSQILHDVPIRDLKKAISINDRHRFIEDLFRGDETMYERSIKTINNFDNFAEAEFWMQRELKLKLAWDNNSPHVKLFDQLVRRRFS